MPALRRARLRAVGFWALVCAVTSPLVPMCMVLLTLANRLHYGLVADLLDPLILFGWMAFTFLGIGLIAGALIGALESSIYSSRSRVIASIVAASLWPPALVVGGGVVFFAVNAVRLGTLPYVAQAPGIVIAGTYYMVISSFLNGPAALAAGLIRSVLGPGRIALSIGLTWLSHLLWVVSWGYITYWAGLW